MVFSFTLFLFLFLPVTLLGYYLIKDGYKNYWILLVSLIFFGWSQPKCLWIILFSIMINYSCAMLINDLQKLRKFVLSVTVAVNLVILFYYKYFDFTIDSINQFSGAEFAIKNIVLPIGISFFAF